MVRKKRAKSKFLDVGKNMPELHHTLQDEEFDWDKSQVLKWISQQPELLTYVKYKLSNAGYIEYDSEKRTWKGIDVYD
jgi:hypothetical protein